jgi:hypothetical protein
VSATVQHQTKQPTSSPPYQQTRINHTSKHHGCWAAANPSRGSLHPISSAGASAALPALPIWVCSCGRSLPTHPMIPSWFGRRYLLPCCCSQLTQQHSLHFLAPGLLLPSLPVGAGLIHLFPFLEAIQVIHDLQLGSTAGRQAASGATASHASFCCCRADALDGQRVKAHMSDPDIESKVQSALAETATLISHNGGSKQQQQQSDSKQAGVLHNFWGSALFRCGQGAKCLLSWRWGQSMQRRNDDSMAHLLANTPRLLWFVVQVLCIGPRCNCGHIRHAAAHVGVPGIVA